MMNPPEPLQGKPPSEEQKQLAAFFQKLEMDQLEFIEAAAKRIIDLTTALLGTLFAVVALGKDFPPPYLKGNAVFQVLTVLTLIFYLGAMFLAMRAIQPRNYQAYRHNLTKMREELDRIIHNKSRAPSWLGRPSGWDRCCW